MRTSNSSRAELQFSQRQGVLLKLLEVLGEGE